MNRRNAGIICAIMSASAFCCFFGPFISTSLSGVRIANISGFELAFDLFNAIKEEGVTYGELASIFAWVSLLETVSLFFSSLALIVEEKKQQKNKWLAVGNLCSGIMVLILNLSIVAVSEYNNIAHLGAGAIISGLLLLIAGIMLFVAIKNDYSDKAVQDYLQGLKTANNSNAKQVSTGKVFGKEVKAKEYCDICNRKRETLYHVVHTSDKMAEAEKYVCDECLKEYNCRIIEKKTNEKTDDKQGSYMGGWVVCPNCGKLRQESESFCGNCGKSLSKLGDDDNTNDSTIKTDNQSIGILNDWITCPNCGKIQRVSKSVCWNCGKSIIDNTQGKG